MSDKQTLRKYYRSQRRNVETNQSQQAAAALAAQIQQTSYFQKSQHIAFYLAHDGEIDPYPLIQLSWQHAKTCYLPCLDPENKNNLLFVSYVQGDPLENNRYKISEPLPTNHNQKHAIELDLVFMPLVAFDAKGNRLGMGGGFYDRTFEFVRQQKTKKPYLLGLAYELQKTDHLPCDSWDIPLIGIATEEKIYEFEL